MSFSGAMKLPELARAGIAVARRSSQLSLHSLFTRFSVRRFISIPRTKHCAKQETARGERWLPSRHPLHVHAPMASILKSSPFFRFIIRESNFYRTHLFVFTFVPLVCSAIFWGVNGNTLELETSVIAPERNPLGENPVSYIDSLFLCYSSMTVTGLTTVNLSTVTPLQQFILFVLMWAGDIVSLQSISQPS